MPEPTLHRPTWAEIDLDNLSFNFDSVRDFVGRDIEYMAVVKADAYGHGMVECSRKLESDGADWFGVALPEEGFELRNAGIRKPILALGSFYYGQENILLDNGITPVVFRLENAESLDAAAKQKQCIANIHVKIDTGMGRVGVQVDEVSEFVDRIKQLENLNVEGVMTHFAVADDLNEGAFTDSQMRNLYASVQIFHEKGLRPKYVDMANSPGAVAHPASRSNMVRIGGILYGLGGDVLPQEIEKPELKPVMSLVTHIAQIKRVAPGTSLGYGRTFFTDRDSLIATIPIGYNDGYSRKLSNRGRTLVNGVFAPVVGRVSMDWTIIDVTDVPNMQVGDRVVLIGEENGTAIKAEDLAAEADTISYEITCGISHRVPRRYTSKL